MVAVPTVATAAKGLGPVLFGPVLGSALVTLLVLALLVVLLVVLVVRTAVGLAWRILPVAAVVLVVLWLLGML